MEMCYNGALVMPSSYAVMNEEEMTYVEGGVSLPMTKNYLNKSNCEKVGKKYSTTTGLTQSRIAKEVYAHAVMYYASPVVLGGYAALICPALPVALAPVLTCLYWIRSHANPVDIGGDSSFRVSVYNAIWKYL